MSLCFPSVGLFRECLVSTVFRSVFHLCPVLLPGHYSVRRSSVSCAASHLVLRASEPPVFRHSISPPSHHSRPQLKQSVFFPFSNAPRRCEQSRRGLAGIREKPTPEKKALLVDTIWQSCRFAGPPPCRVPAGWTCWFGAGPASSIGPAGLEWGCNRRIKEKPLTRVGGENLPAAQVQQRCKFSFPVFFSPSRPRSGDPFGPDDLFPWRIVRGGVRC